MPRGSKPVAPPVQVTEAQLRQLAKMLGLLGSEHAGERAAAALKAAAWVKARDLAWVDLLIPEDVPPPVRVSVGSDSQQAKQIELERVRARLLVEAAQDMVADAQRKQAEAERLLAQARAAQPVTPVGAPGAAPGPRYGVGVVGGAGTAAYAQATAGRAQATAATGEPAWLPLARTVLADHPQVLRGSKEQAFLESQVERAEQWGVRVKVSDKQELWLRDILGRAGLSW